MEEQNHKKKKDNFDLTDGTNDLYYALTSSKSLVCALQDLGVYLRNKRQTVHPSGQIFPISKESSAILTVHKNDEPLQGSLTQVRGHIFSEHGMTRNWPFVLDLGPTKVSFARPKALAWRINTIHKDFRMFDVSAVGDVIEKFTLTEQEIRTFKLRFIQEQAEEELPTAEKIRPLMRESVKKAISPILEYYREVAEEQSNYEHTMEVEGQIKGEITKERYLEHEDQIEKTVSTANTMAKFDDLPSDISDRCLQLEKENEKLKAENNTQGERIASLEKQDVGQSEKIQQLETENQDLQNKVSILQKQLETITNELAKLQTKYEGLETSRITKKKKIKLNSGEPLVSDQQLCFEFKQENTMSVEYHSSQLEEEDEKQDNMNDSINPKEYKDSQTTLVSKEKNLNPIVSSALESLDHYKITGLMAGVIDLFIQLYSIQKSGKDTSVQIYDSTKWEFLSAHENVSMHPVDYGYENKRLILYPLHLRLGDKQYWSLLILRNSKKWDHTAIISAYYLSSLANDEPPKGLLTKVLMNIAGSVEKRLAEKEPKASPTRYKFGAQLVPLPLGNIKLEKVNVSNKTNSFEETGFHLLNWLHCAIVKTKTFFGEISKPNDYIRSYEREEIVKRWEQGVREHLEKHLYKAVSIQTEKRMTRSTQKLETTASKFYQNPKQKNKVY